MPVRPPIIYASPSHGIKRSSEGSVSIDLSWLAQLLQNRAVKKAGETKENSDRQRYLESADATNQAMQTLGFAPKTEQADPNMQLPQSSVFEDMAKEEDTSLKRPPMFPNNNIYGAVAPEEYRFKSWYTDWAGKLGLDPNPDNPKHQYDYRAAYKAGATPDAAGHWPSEFKLPEHPKESDKDRILNDMATKDIARRGRVSGVALNNPKLPESEKRNFLGIRREEMASMLEKNPQAYKDFFDVLTRPEKAEDLRTKMYGKLSKEEQLAAAKTEFRPTPQFQKKVIDKEGLLEQEHVSLDKSTFHPYGFPTASQKGLEAMKEGAISGKNKFDMEANLRDDFTGNPAVKAFREIKPRVLQARELVDKVDKGDFESEGLLDVTLNILMLKINEPESAAMLGETQNVEAARSLMSRAGSYLNRLAAGQMFSKQERKDILDIAETAYRIGYKQNSLVEKGFAPVIKDYKLSSKNIFVFPSMKERYDELENSFTDKSGVVDKQSVYQILEKEGYLPND